MLCYQYPGLGALRGRLQACLRYQKHSPNTALSPFSSQIPSHSNGQVISILKLSSIHGRHHKHHSSKVSNMQESLIATHAIPLQRPGDPLSQSSVRQNRHIPQSLPRARAETKLPLRYRIPKDAWDSHMHVIDDKYDLAADAVYTPNPHTLEDAISFETSVGIRNIVLVQPSIYGYDNSCLLDTLQRLGPQRARGVVSFDPHQTTSDQLLEWHGMGVRGVRLNISSNGRRIEISELENLLQRYADAVRPLNWVLQVYLPMALIAALESIIPSLNVRFCIDHLGHPGLAEFGGSDPYQLPGFFSLAKLLKGGHVFVKLSAPYRLSCLEDQRDLEPVAREVLRLGGYSRVVFATDWPHTRFEGLDIRPWMEKVLDWCNGDQTLVDRLFRGNAEDLWSVARRE